MSPTIRAIQTVIVFLQTLLAGLVTTTILMELHPLIPVVAAFGMLAVTAGQHALNTFQNGTVVENVDGGKVVAGPANELPTGTVVREAGSLYLPERAIEG